MQVDVNGFLGGAANGAVNLVPDTDVNFVNLSTTITAHELGHTLGLRHEDALGPIGFGISNPPGITTYYPTFDGLVGAFTTVNDVMASPAAVGSTLADAASGDSTFGERDAIKLAFISDGTVVAGTRNDGTATVTTRVAATPTINQANEAALITALTAGGAAATFAPVTVNAQAVNLYTLNVPNPITSGINAGKAFDVAAVDVIGHIGGTTPVTIPDPNNPGRFIAPPDPKNPGQTLALTQATPDFYTFQGAIGDVMNFEVTSSALTRIAHPIDAVVYVYDPNGNLVAWNDDEFEPSDSTIVDLKLQMTGTYTVEVDSYNNNTDPTLLDPTSKNYDPAAYYHAQQGDYELFMYRSDAYNPTSGADLLTTSNAPTVQVASATQGQEITLTATLNLPSPANLKQQGNPGSLIQGGTVTFYVGDPVPLGTAEVHNGVAVLTLSASTLSRLTAESQGAPTITAQYNGDGDNNFVASPFSAPLAQTVPTVTVSDAGGTYNGGEFDAIDSVNGGAALEGVGLTLTYYSGTDVAGPALSGAPIDAGTYTVVAFFAGSADYTAASAQATFTINKADLYVTATANTKTYGQTATDTGTLTGVVNGDGITATFSSAGDAAGAVVGTDGYTITDALSDPNGKLANYTVHEMDASLTVSARAVTVTADALSKTYGNADPALTYKVTAGSLVSGDAFSGALTRVAGENVGAYAITQGTLALSSNYSLTYVGANLTISARAVTVTADALSKTYGAADPALTYKVTAGSLVTGDAFTGALSRVAGENVGAYAITQGTLALSSNYSLTYVGANLTISARAVTVTADALSKTYGNADPALTYKVTAGSLVSGDAFSGALSRVAGENVGAYAITQGTLVLSSNYTLTYVGANLTINARAVTVTADALSKTYGAADPALTYKVTAGALVSGDAFSGALTRVVGENVGSYAITQGTLALSSNYSLTYVGANLTITARAVTVTADALSKTYGAADPALTYKVTAGSLVTGDAFTGSLSRVAGENVGSYAITQGTLALSSNYSLTYVGANLTITARAVTVTADALSKTYGAADPALTYKVTAGALVSGDAFSGSLSRAAGENVGAYAITQGTLALSSNYTLTYVGANLTINKATLTVTANNATKVYGQANPAFSDTITGYVNNDPSTVVSGVASLTTNATTASSPGAYTITASQGTLGATNYTFAFQTGTLTVNKDATSSVVSASANPVLAGQALTFTATVSAASPGSGTATGSVQFLDGTTLLDTETLANGSATSKSLSFSTSGNHSITAVYAGDTNFTGAASSPLTEVVNAATTGTTTTLTASAATVNYDQGVTLTAAVAASSGTPTGSVDFKDVTTGLDLGTATLSGGKATLTTTALPLGAQAITGDYSPTGNFQASTSPSTTVTVSVTANSSVYLVNATAAGALTLSGNAQITLPGVVYVDSSSTSAINISGNAMITAGAVQTTGHVLVGGNNTHISPAAVTGAAAFTDPMLGLAAPTATGMTTYAAVNLSGNSSQTINPGVYSSITVSGNGKLTMTAGVYLIAGGGFSVSGNGSVSGGGIMIYNGGSNLAADSGTFGAVTLSGNGAISLTPTTTGAYANILIFQSRNNTKVLTLSGNSMVIPGGLIYAPAAAILSNGNGQFKGSIVANTMNVSGNSILNEAVANGTTVYNPTQIRTAYGVNNLALDGTGQTIAIVDAYDDPQIYQSLDAFSTTFGATTGGPNLFQQYGPASSFLTVVNQQGQTDNLPSVDPTGAGGADWELEEALDVEWIHATAPGAKIVLVEANSDSLSDPYDGEPRRRPRAQPGVSVVSMSWGFPGRLVRRRRRRGAL